MLMRIKCRYRLSMAEGGEVVDRVREYRGEREADGENLIESFLCKTEVPLRVDEDEDFSLVVDFLKMTFEKVSSRFNELLQELNSVDFGEKFKKLVKEREDIHRWVEGLKFVYREGYFKSSVEESVLIEKEIKRQETNVEEMMEILTSCWLVEKDLAQPLNLDIDELAYYLPLTGELFFICFLSFVMEGGRHDFDSVDQSQAYEQRRLFQQAICGFTSLVKELQDGVYFDAVLCDLFIERERLIRWWKDTISYLEDIGVVGENSIFLKQELKREEEIIDDLFVFLLELRNLQILKEVKL